MKGTYNIIASWADGHGHTKSYTALTFTVGCEITSFQIKDSYAPPTFTYNVFSSRKIVSLTAVVYEQVPACGYTFTNNFDHQDIGAGVEASIIFAGAVVIPSFEVYSTNPAHEASYTVTLANAITIDAGQGQSATTFTPPSVSQTISVVNQCKDTTVNAITFSPSAIIVNDGSEGTSDFVIPTDAVDTANSLTSLCGARTYAIADSTGTINDWAVITDHALTAGSKTLTIKTPLYPTAITEPTKVITLTVTSSLADWSGAIVSTTDIDVTITRLVCDCNRMIWIAPTTQTVTVNVGATTSFTTT